MNTIEELEDQVKELNEQIKKKQEEIKELKERSENKQYSKIVTLSIFIIIAALDKPTAISIFNIVFLILNILGT